MGHVYHHQNTPSEIEELAADSLYQHFRWSQAKMGRVLARLRASNLIQMVNNVVQLTPRGEAYVKTFRQTNLVTEADAKLS